MGFMTLTDFRSEVAQSLGSRGVDETRIDRWINMAYLDLAGAIDFEVFEAEVDRNTVASTASVDAPAEAMMIKIVRDSTNDRSLGWIEKNEYFRRPASTEGEPQNWTWHMDKVLLHPVPDAVYSIKLIYRSLPTALSSAGATTELPDMWDLPITQLAVYLGLLGLGEEQRATVWYGRAVNYIQTRLSEDLLHATSSGLGLSLPPIRQLDIRPFVGQMGSGGGQ